MDGHKNIAEVANVTITNLFLHFISVQNMPFNYILCKSMKGNILPIGFNDAHGMRHNTGKYSTFSYYIYIIEYFCLKSIGQI